MNEQGSPNLTSNLIRYRRRKKRQIVSHIQKHGYWEGYLCPSKMYPRMDHPFNMALSVTFTKDMLEYSYPGAGSTPFENVLNNFEYYNCTSETGRYIHYYENWKDETDGTTETET